MSPCEVTEWGLQQIFLSIEMFNLGLTVGGWQTEILRQYNKKTETIILSSKDKRSSSILIFAQTSPLIFSLTWPAPISRRRVFPWIWRWRLSALKTSRGNLIWVILHLLTYMSYRRAISPKKSEWPKVPTFSSIPAGLSCVTTTFLIWGDKNFCYETNLSTWKN